MAFFKPERVFRSQAYVIASIGLLEIPFSFSSIKLRGSETFLVCYKQYFNDILAAACEYQVLDLPNFICPDGIAGLRSVFKAIGELLGQSERFLLVIQRQGYMKTRLIGMRDVVSNFNWIYV